MNANLPRRCLDLNRLMDMEARRAGRQLALLLVAALLSVAVTGQGATLDFNGVNQFLRASPVNLVLSSNVTFEAWVNPRTAKCNTILSRGHGGGGVTDFIIQTGYDGAGSCNSRLVAFWGAGAWDTSSTPVPLGEWTHVAVTFDGFEKKFYINGALDRTVRRPGQLAKSNDPFLFVGRQGTSCACNYFDGEMDEVRIWDETRSQNQIQETMNARLAGTEPGLVVYYPLDEGAGPVTADASGSDNTGSLVNDPTWNIFEDAVVLGALTRTATLVTNTSVQLNGLVNTYGVTTTNRFEWGAASTVLGFNGANQYASVTAGDLVLSNRVTFQAWVRPHAAKFNTILSRGNGANSGITDYIFSLASGRQLGFMGVGVWDYSNSQVPLNEWTHVAVTFDGAVKRFYINGLLDRVVDRPGQLYQSSSVEPLLLGRQGSACNCNYFDGEIDDVRIWNVVRSDSEIMADANSSLAGNEPGLLADYRMEDGIGPKLSDASLNGNHATLQNYPAWLPGARPVFDQSTGDQVVTGDNSVLHLDGIDDHVTAPPDVYFGAEFTIESWVFERSYNHYARVIDFGNGQQAQNVLFALSELTSGRPAFQVYPDPVLVAPNPVPLNEWVHLAVTVKTNRATIYVNGVAVVSGPATTPSGVIRNQNYIGRSNWGSDPFANARFDDVRIWSVARTPEELRQFSQEAVSPDDPNLVLNYRFDEAAGTVAVDSRTTAPRNGTLVNGAGRLSSLPVSVTLSSLAPGKVYYARNVAQNANGIAVGQTERFVSLAAVGGTALDLDGANDFVRIAGFGPRMPTNEVTVEFWQRVHSVKNQSTFAISPDVGGNRFQAHVPWSDGQVYWDFGGSRLQYLPPVSLVGTWQHFSLVSSVAGNYMRIYRNGILEAEKVGAGQFTRGTHDLVLGNNGPYFFAGELDDFRVWNVARSQAEIAGGLRQPITGSEPGLVAFYRMNEAAGGTLQDVTINAHHGYMANGPLWVPSRLPLSGEAFAFTNASTITLAGYQPVIKLIATPSVNNLIIGLNSDITPGAGTPGVEFTDGNAALNLTLQYGGGTSTILTSGESAAGLRVVSAGANGAGGNGNGQPGVAGGTTSIESAGPIMTTGNQSAGIQALSQGGAGGRGESGDGDGNPGGVGGAGGASIINSTSSIVTSGASSAAILAISRGGDGGRGGNGEDRAFFDDDGGNGGEGGNGGAVLINGGGNISTTGSDSIGVLAISQAGRGGDGGEGHGDGDGGSGSVGGDAGTATVHGSWSIHTLGESAFGVSARSLGGGGGRGNEGGWIDGDGGLGGGSGDGSIATVLLRPGGTIETEGLNGHGIFAQSIGGFAGTGGAGGGIVSSSGGNGGSAGNGGNVIVTNQGAIITRGQGAHGIFAESVGGGGGAAGSGSGLFSGEGDNGQSSAGGNAGEVVVRNLGQVTTVNNFSRGVFAQSVGGSGGDGPSSSGLFYSVGGAGGKGGDGNFVDVRHDGSIVTGGNDAVGLFAQSVGGGGGTGGGAASMGAFASVSIGGRGGAGGDGASVKVDTGEQGTINTTGNRSHGIFAQSVGGGGGNGGFAVAAATGASFSVAVGSGGNGGGGGSASNVVVTSASDITTGGTNSHAIVAQSVGGGGGSGGFSIAVSGGGGMSGAVSVGGGAGGGGAGQEVSLQSTGAITTGADRSYGLLAQSVGGGGGDGGFSIAGAAGSAGLAASLGGSGGLGGAGSTVVLDSGSHIQTAGADAHGIVAQSVGGGGGSGGFSIASAAGGAGALSASLGGSGGNGGSAGIVTVNNWNTVETLGRHSYGILVQSVGGGGGDGGFSIAGTVSQGPALAFSMGGSGGMGGTGAGVELLNSGDIVTAGELAHGIVAQSVGGGGGSGGFSVSAALSGNSGGLGFSMGGAGGSGVEAGMVTVDTSGSIETTSKGSHAIFAQSVGGGGGSGGFAGSLAGGFGNGANLSVAIGGDGGTGGASERVTVTNRGALLVRGEGSSGIYAQSVGGGGGDGGDSLSASFGTGAKSVNMSLAIGGNGGDGGIARQVDVRNFQLLSTLGSRDAHGIFAQSIGGGGGNGGFAASGTLSTSSTNKQISVSIGGSGGTGGVAGAVSVLNTSLITTIGEDSAGIHAQSIGGGGGNGGASFSGTFTGTGTKSASVSLGGDGGIGGNASTVNVMNDGGIQTSGERSRGIFAHSVGGGGGNGGWSASLNLTLAAPDSKSTQIAISVGGEGGAGGIGGDVLVAGSGDILTAGNDSEGVFAQSVGGGGGNGGAGLSGSAVLGAGQAGSTNVAWSLAIGGEGGIGNRGGTVTVDRNGTIETRGDGSHAIFGQSVGGGGGTGGSARSVNLFLKSPGATEATNSSNVSRELSFGGNGGEAGIGGAVKVTNVGNIATYGGDAHGIFAQSVGGGGGTGGNGHKGIDNLIEEIDVDGVLQQVVDSVEAKSSGLEYNFGGSGGSGNHGGVVSVDQTGDIITQSAGSYGVLAQSLGAGGGVGGNGITSPVNVEIGGFRLGGENGAGGDGSNVVVMVAGKVDTSGAGAHGIVAQSVGGGGGVAGNVVHGFQNVGPSVGYDTNFLGQGGGGSGDGGVVSVNTSDTIVTRGAGAAGIFAQSVGGGGGVAGGNESSLDFAGSVGGTGDGRQVLVSHTGGILTSSDHAHGIFGQSAGGIGMGGNVGIFLDGRIVAQGAGADGIFAQSRGGSGNGNIDITVRGIGVQGGAGLGAGIRFFDGANNTLNNFGMISSLGGSAIVGGSGNETVHNFGTVVGSVDLGSGNNAFNNSSGAVVDLGGAGLLSVGAGGTLDNGGLLTGTGQIIGNVTSSGSIAPGSSTGSLLIDGSLSLQATAGIFLDIGGHEKGVTHDSIQVTSLVEFAGTLTLRLDNNFVPRATDTFTLMEFASMLGSFGNASDGARLATQDNLASFQVDYTSTTLQVSGYQSPDTDGDGMSDHEESLAGTDRLLPESVMALTSVAVDDSNHTVIRFARVIGKSYTIEYRQTLESGVWIEVPSPAITIPDAGTGQWIDTGVQTGGLGGATKFYRVKLKL